MLFDSYFVFVESSFGLAPLMAVDHQCLTPLPATNRLIRWQYIGDRWPWQGHSLHRRQRVLRRLWPSLGHLSLLFFETLPFHYLNNDKLKSSTGNHSDWIKPVNPFSVVIDGLPKAFLLGRILQYALGTSFADWVPVKAIVTNAFISFQVRSAGAANAFPSYLSGVLSHWHYPVNWFSLWSGLHKMQLSLTRIAGLWHSKFPDLGLKTSFGPMDVQTPFILRFRSGRHIHSINLTPS